jgi:hypothetical protein
MMDDIRPRGMVEVGCSTPNCGWSFWVASDDIRLPEGPFFCDACSEHATYEFVCSHRQEASRFLVEATTPGSPLHFTLGALGEQRIRVTIEKILPGEN